VPEFLGSWEFIVLALLVLVLFGAKRLPDSARALGRSMRIFKAETKGLRSDDETPSPTPTRTETVVPVSALPQPVQAQQVHTQPAQAQPVQVQPVQAQPVQAQPVQAAPVQHTPDSRP